MARIDLPLGLLDAQETRRVAKATGVPIAARLANRARRLRWTDTGTIHALRWGSNSASIVSSRSTTLLFASADCRAVASA